MRYDWLKEECIVAKTLFIFGKITSASGSMLKPVIACTGSLFLPSFDILS
jgi:hypothetical protein